MVGKAILENPDKFAEAAKTLVAAQGAQIENVGKAVDVLTKARSAIAHTTTKHATIINLSKKAVTWYTYNDLAPVKWTTTMRSTMGPYCTVTVHSIGTGAMATFANNKKPQFTLERGKSYAYDGKYMTRLYFAE